MITPDVHTEVHVYQQQTHPNYSTCFECHRSFRPKSEHQLNLHLCERCFQDHTAVDPVVHIHVKVLPHRPPVL